MLVPPPHGSSVPVIVRFEHFELVPVQVLGTGTDGSNLAKRLTTQH
jgi:hypothetical protein